MFSTILTAQQVSMFLGVILRIAASVFAMSDVDIWVMDTRVGYIDEVIPMRDIELLNVRTVEGIEWAVPFYRGLNIINPENADVQNAVVLGVDTMSLVGACTKMVVGSDVAIRQPQSAIMDVDGYHFIWGRQALVLPKFIELNEHRIKIVALCNSAVNFNTRPIIYLGYNEAMDVIAPARNKLSFVLVKARQGENITALKHRIMDRTHLQALTTYEFAQGSVMYILRKTAISMNFGITILMGAVIGLAIISQTFYIFILDKLQQFATMKAMGFTNKQLMHITLIQASIVGVVGYCLGISFTGLFFYSVSALPALRDFQLYWQVMLGSSIFIAILVVISIGFGLRKVFTVDPAIVFRG